MKKKNGLTDLFCVLTMSSCPMHCGEADVILLYDWGVQAIKIQEQYEFVVKTYEQ